MPCSGPALPREAAAWCTPSGMGSFYASRGTALVGSRLRSTVAALQVHQTRTSGRSAVRFRIMEVVALQAALASLLCPSLNRWLWFSIGNGASPGREGGGGGGDRGGGGGDAGASARGGCAGDRLHRADRTLWRYLAPRPQAACDRRRRTDGRCRRHASAPGRCRGAVDLWAAGAELLRGTDAHSEVPWTPIRVRRRHLARGRTALRVLTRSLRLSYVKGAISAASAFALAAALHTPPAPLA